jgi:hypothetical protein
MIKNLVISFAIRSFISKVKNFQDTTSCDFQSTVTCHFLSTCTWCNLTVLSKRIIISVKNVNKTRDYKEKCDDITV